MISNQSYKRFPAIRCWIKHIFEGRFKIDENKIKILYTIFGKTKRVRIVATIIKRERIENQESNDITDTDIDVANLKFELDDGTGFISVVLWGTNPDKYKDFVKGDIVDIVGMVRGKNGFISINIEIIKKIIEPNFILLRDAEIIKKINTGEIYEIPDVSEDNLDIDEVSNEIDIETLYEDDQTHEGDDIKGNIYTIIEKNTLEGNGISFKELKERTPNTEEDLRKILGDLEMESKIYQSEENVYQTFK